MAPTDLPPSGPAGGSAPRLFTLAEANALLPELIPILERLRLAKAALDDARAGLARLTPAMRGNGHAAAGAELEGRIRELAAEIAADVRAILARGVEVKDLDHGLIDFPSPREGRVVFLCCRLGEGPIGWWHETDAGFAGRRPL